MKTKGVWQVGLIVALALLVVTLSLGFLGGNAALASGGPKGSNVETVRELYDSFLKGDIQAMLGHLAADVEFISPGPTEIGFAGTHRGHQAFQDFAKKLNETLEFSQFEPREFISEGDTVVALGHEAGRARATGEPFETDFVQVWTFNSDGQVARMQSFEDTFQTAQALGIMDAGRGLASPMQSNEPAARRLFEAENDANVINELLSEDFVGHSPGMPDIHGPQKYFESMSVGMQAFPDMKITIDETIASGDKVVIRWSASGTNTGKLMAMEPTGKKVNMTGITVMTFKDGKLIEQHEEWDSAGMMQQLGLIPPMEGVDPAAAEE